VALRFLMLMAWLAVAAPLSAGQLSGTVSAADQAVPGATVVATRGDDKVSTTTDESGQYSLEDLATGVWLVEVQMFGFASQSRSLLLESGPANADWILGLRSIVEAAGKEAEVAEDAKNAVQNLAVSPSVENQVLATLADPSDAETPEASTASEALVVVGSVSRGLIAPLQEDIFSRRRADLTQQPETSPSGQEGGGPVDPDGAASGTAGFGAPPSGGLKSRGRASGFGRGGAVEGGRPKKRKKKSKKRSADTDIVDFGNRSNTGSDAIRGAVFYSLRNSALDARPFSLTGQTVPQPAYAQSRFGFSAGGMLRIPKIVSSEETFFFASYSGLRSRNPYQGTSTLPTMAERNGDFSQSGSRIFDPITGLAYQNNRLPANRRDPAADGLLKFIPLANQPGRVQNYQYLASDPQNADNLSVRLNHNFTRRDAAALAFHLQSRNGGFSQLYGIRDATDGLGYNSTLSWTHTMGSKVLSRLAWNFSRNRNNTLPFFAFQQDTATLLGIQGASHDPLNFGPPNLSFTNFGGLTDASAVLRRDQTAGVSEAVSWVRGAHNLTTGGEYRRLQFNARTDQNARGTFAFSGIVSSDYDLDNHPLPGTGYDLADFLIGQAQKSSVRFGSGNTYFRGSAYSAYAVDDWRLRPHLTLNLGLRYEFFTPLTEKYDRIANLDIAPAFTGVAVVTPGDTGPFSGVFPRSLIDADKNNWSPRVGLAWRPFGKRHFHVRAGYGVFYDGSTYSLFPNRLASQPPFGQTASLTTSLSRPLFLEDGLTATSKKKVTNSYAVDRGYRVGYAQTWNLSVQHDLPYSLVVEVGYLGTKGTRLDIQRLPNRAPPGSPLTAEDRRLIGNAVGFTFDSSAGNSIYHAGQVRVTRRLHRGVSVNALYTLSKSIDDASTFGGGAVTVAQDDTNLRAERGLSSFDQRHVLTLSYVITSPVGPNAQWLRGGGRTARILEGWTLSGSATGSSGTPFTARLLGNQSDSRGTGSVGNGRADSSGAPIEGGGGFFNLAAFAIPPLGRYGNAARNTIPGPKQLAFNISLSRSFHVKEQRRLDFRIDSQNFTNYVGYSSLATVINATNYGLATSTRPMRTVTATLRFRF
jgi:hypothetical protein